MPDEILLDFTSKEPVKRKRRSRRDAKRYWRPRFNALVRDGFTYDEAAWAADRNIPLGKLKKVRTYRKAHVKWYMRTYNYTRAKSIELASKDLENRIENMGGDEHNIFYEVGI